MKLDTRAFRHLAPEDWRVLTAVEMGSRNHEVVPTPLIIQIAGLRGGAGLAHRALATLAKANLVARQPGARYDGYRLTYGGLDHLALRAHARAGALGAVGAQIGTGKESDVYVCAPPKTTPGPGPGGKKNGRADPPAAGGADADEPGAAGAGRTRRVLKLHRLGRTSFRSVKNKRDYLRGRHAGSWLYLSRLAAMKEHACMRALHAAGFPVPAPLGVNRHAVVMALVDGTPLRAVARVPDPPALYAELLDIVVRLAGVGLIHGDFNEFNVMIVEEGAGAGEEPAALHREDAGEEPAPTQGEAAGASTAAAGTAADANDPRPPPRIVPVLIDFPQMVSTSHADARMYFERDVACVKRFFARRFGFTSTDPGPTFDEAMQRARALGTAALRLDVEVEACGFSRKMAKDLEGYMQEAGRAGEGADEGEAGDDLDVDDEEDGSSEDSDVHRSDGELDLVEQDGCESTIDVTPQRISDLRIKE